ncbi:MAG: cation:dicarboxylate symporter family transporter [Bilophila wadsworthia]
MIIAPIIFCTVVLGVAGMEDMKKLNRISSKALIYFGGDDPGPYHRACGGQHPPAGWGMHVDPASSTPPPSPSTPLRPNTTASSTS